MPSQHTRSLACSLAALAPEERAGAGGGEAAMSGDFFSAAFSYLPLRSPPHCNHLSRADCLIPILIIKQITPKELARARGILVLGDCSPAKGKTHFLFQ